jgi:Skp family chaperone for outer membrane proteins
MNKSVIGATLVAFAAFVPAAAQAQKLPDTVIAVVDTSRVYQECNACKTAQAQLQAQGTSFQQRAQQLAQPIQTEGQSIETAIKALNGKQPDAALTARIQALQTKQASANQELQGRQQNLESMRANVVKQINDRLSPIFTQVMNARGANILLDSDATLASGRSLDVTNDVLAALNQQLTSISVTPLPQAPAGQPSTQGR